MSRTGCEIPWLSAFGWDTEKDVALAPDLLVAFDYLRRVHAAGEDRMDNSQAVGSLETKKAEMADELRAAEQRIAKPRAESGRSTWRGREHLPCESPGRAAKSDIEPLRTLKA